MAFVSKLMATPAIFILAIALVCVVGCGSEADTSGVKEAAPSADSGGSGSDAEESSDKGSASDTEE